MSVRYSSFRGKPVSHEWATVLKAAEASGVRFTLNSGHRSMAEQAALVRQKGVWSPSNRTGAAVPSANAPHIRVGRIDHALDINQLDGGHMRLSNFIKARGGRTSFPVFGEPWHMEVPESDLRKLAEKLDDPLEGYTDDEKRWIREYDSLLKLKRNGRDSVRRLVRRASLRRRMKRQAKLIKKMAEKSRGGWGRYRRRDRYDSLNTRAS